MKPVSLSFQCFGPYMEPQFIDFARLEQSGLFLICGETGAGKTTILDAMCYALYGRSSGGLRGELEVMRCKLAGRDDETRVEFIFDRSGRRYKFTRSLRMRRKNLCDEHNCLVREGEVYVPLLENPKQRSVNQMAQELLGLTYEQFRQVVILPQGQFERLLVSNSAEKEEILVSLFHADRWQRMAEEVYARASAQDARLRRELADMTARLAARNCRDLEELAAVEAEARSALTEAGVRLTLAEAEAQARRRSYDSALVESSGFQELDRRQKQAAALEARRPAMERERDLLGRSDDAEAISPQYDACEQARRQREEAEAGLRREERALAEAVRQAEAVQARKAAHDGAGERCREQRRQIARLESVQALYGALAEKKAAADAAARTAAEEKAALSRAEAAWTGEDLRWRQAMERQDRIMEDYREAQHLYFRDISGLLARDLAEGRPCPVCGSLHHPAPAALSAGCPVTRQDLDRNNQALTEAGEAVKAAAVRRDAAEQAKARAQSAHAQAERLAAAARSEYDALAGQRIAGVDTAADLARQLAELRQAVAAYEEEEASLSSLLAQARQAEAAQTAARTLARSALAAAEEAYADKAAQWALSLVNRGFSDQNAFLAARLDREERERRRAALIRWQTELLSAQEALDRQRRELGDRQPPDLALADNRWREADAALKEATRRQALAQREAAALKEELAELTKRHQAHQQSRLMADEDLEFANRLMGRSGISLQRYVLGVMLGSITREANRLLESVHGGRYQLYRTDEIAGSGRKGGLELEVLDRRSGQRRSVTTLSGGEKFLAALSLAIGLSAVVQAQGTGVQLEAMFIDEGFGSLDDASIDDALEVLQGVQRAHGLVGIISHVQRLAETIPSRLEIAKSGGGSRCVLR